MKNIIIVDHKEARIGRIREIIKYSEIKVETIIECNSEEDAYEKIKNNNINLLIICLTKNHSDGIILLKKINKIRLKPKVIIISYLDTSSDIVELLRCGIKEYLYGNFQDSELITTIKKLEEEYKEEKEEVTEKVFLLYSQIKHLLVQNKLDENVAKSLNSILSKYITNIYYKIICTNYKMKSNINNNCFYFHNINRHNVIIIESDKAERFINENLNGFGFGISNSYTDIKCLMNALNEAIELRKENFFLQLNKKVNIKEERIIDEYEIERLINLIGTNRLEVSTSYLKRIVMLVKRSEISKDSFLDLINKIYSRIYETYKGIIEEEKIKLELLENAFNYTNIDIYCQEIYLLMVLINKKLLNKYDFYKNRIKIEEAVRYINKNFKDNINMTFISNYVSMNYTIFSIDFKEYTGKNFVNYLKEVRLKEAKRLLDETDMKINEISEAVGYDNDKHFMKTFKGVFSVTPTEYRKNIKSGRDNRIV